MRRMIAIALLLLPALATAPPGKNQNTADLATYGLRGKVHSQRLIIRRLANSPLPEAMAFRMVASPPDWLVFDRNGFVIERAYILPEDGSAPNLVRYKYKLDTQGRLMECLKERREAAPERTVYRYGEYGPLETKTFLGDKLRYTEVVEYDERGNPVRSRFYRGSDDLIWRTEAVFDKNNCQIEMTRFGAKGQILEHTKERFDDKGNLVESDELDSQNRIVSTMVFKGDVLVSWRMDTAYRASKGITEIEENIGPNSYELKEDGTVVTFVHHNSAGISWGYDDQAVEALDQKGKILQKVTFQYKRDSDGNWTHRTVSVFDSNTGSMVPIQEGIRQIMYY